jgi:hypothetical protein
MPISSDNMLCKNKLNKWRAVLPQLCLINLEVERRRLRRHLVHLLLGSVLTILAQHLEANAAHHLHLRHREGQ